MFVAVHSYPSRQRALVAALQPQWLHEHRRGLVLGPADHVSGLFIQVCQGIRAVPIDGTMGGLVSGDKMGTMGDPDVAVTALHRVKTQIRALTELQANALKQATFVGMTPHEAKEYDERRSEIVRLLGQSEALEKAQQVPPPPV